MSRAPDRWMTEAIRLAVENVRSGRGGPFGAVIVRGEEILATGANQVTRTNDPTAHAEIVAIRSACAAVGDFRLMGCVLYTSCEPCPMCLAAIYWSHLDAVHFAATHQDAASYGFDDAFLYDEMRKPILDRSLPMHPVSHPEAALPFQQWAASRNKILY